MVLVPSPSSGADKSYGCSLCDKSTKFGMETLFLYHFKMGTMKILYLYGQNHTIKTDETVKLYSAYKIWR